MHRISSLFFTIIMMVRKILISNLLIMQWKEWVIQKVRNIFLSRIGWVSNITVSWRWIIWRKKLLGLIIYTTSPGHLNPKKWRKGRLIFLKLSIETVSNLKKLSLKEKNHIQMKRKRWLLAVIFVTLSPELWIMSQQQRRISSCGLLQGWLDSRKNT